MTPVGVALGDQVPDPHLVAAVDGALTGCGHVARRISTHVDRGGPVAAPLVVVELEPAGPAPAVLDALAAALGGSLVEAPASGGRYVRFVGQERVTGDHPVAELLALTELDEVVGVGRAVAPDDVVATAGFLRPQRGGGRLVLLVEPAAGGRLRPVEVESPHQCCGGAHR